jgi:Ca2+-binding EF-hand superfamily protein
MHGKAHQIEEKQGNLLEIIMKAYFSKALLAASIGALGLATASAVSAEPPAQDPAPQGWGRCEQNPATWRDQARAGSEARFKQLDADSDGTVSKAEAEKGPPHLAEQFDEVDANKDGKLTQDEMRNARRARMAQCKEDPEKCRAEMKQRFETAWKRADTDGDGTLSKPEAEQGMPRMARHFDRIDTDRDGRITLAEMDAARARHPHPHRAPKPDASPSSAPQTKS